MNEAKAIRPSRPPAAVQVITIGGDVQEDHVWYVVVGWGYLFEPG